MDNFVNFYCCFFIRKAFLILFATIAGSFCAEPVNVEVSTQQPVKDDAQPQKRALLSDCDGPILGGLHSDVAVHSDLGLGHGYGYAPSYSTGYSGGYSTGYSSGYSGSYLGTSGLIGGISSIGAVGHVGAVVAPHVVSAGYAAHAPVIASSVISTPVVAHQPVIAAPAVRYILNQPSYFS